MKKSAETVFSCIGSRLFFSFLPTIQDMLVPISQLKGSLECFHQEVEIYPIWLCPFKLPNNPGMLKTQMQNGENEAM